MEERWTKKNVIWMVILAILYVITTVIVCVLGSVHPIKFVCYQITAGVLITGVVTKAFSLIKAPGVACCLSFAMVLTFFAIQDASIWHIVPLIVIAVLAEIVRVVGKYGRAGDMIAAVIMTFSTFGFYGQIWLNRDFTYESAIEEMPEGYGDALMAVSPAWALPVVILIGVVLSLLFVNITRKLFKLEYAG